MGCSTLYHLATEGVTDAVLLERNELHLGDNLAFGGAGPGVAFNGT